MIVAFLYLGEDYSPLAIDIVHWPFLNIGVTRATFHSIGNLSVAIDILKIFVKCSAIAGAAAFNTLAEISSIYL